MGKAKILTVATMSDLLEYAGDMALKSNLEELIDTSVIENTYVYADKLQKIKDITPENGAKALLKSADAHLTEYADIEGEYIARRVAENICHNQHGIPDVIFTVPEAVKQKLSESTVEYEAKYLKQREVVEADLKALNTITYEMTAENNAEKLAEIKDNLKDADVLLANADLTNRDFGNTTMNLNMYACENLSMDNYAERLSDSKDTAAKEWATNAIENMVRGLYSNDDYNKLSHNDIINSIYIDGDPALQNKSGPDYQDNCAKIIQRVLEGGHRVNIRGMEEKNGKVVETEKLASVEVKPNVKCEEKFSLWKAILRFFGIIKSEKQKAEQKISFAQLGNEDALEKIQGYDLVHREFADKIEPLRQANQEFKKQFKNIDRYAFESNLENPDKYFSSIPRCYEYDKDKGQMYSKSFLTTLNRMGTRDSVLMAYAKSKGMELENMLNPSEEDKQRLKQYGKEFIDLVTLPSREEIAKQVYPDYSDENIKNIVKTNDKAFVEAYSSTIKTKIDKFSKAYIDSTNAISAYKETLPQAECADMQSVINALPSHSFYETVRVDLFQILGKQSIILKNELANEAKENNRAGTQDTRLKSNFIAPLTSSGMSTVIPLDNKDLSKALTAMYYLREPDASVNCGLERNEAMDAGYQVILKEFDENHDLQLVNYAKDIIMGKKPMPDGLFTQHGMDKNGRIIHSHLKECFQHEKETQLEKTLDKSLDKSRER